MTNKIAVVIGAGPAGLTAAYELLSRTDIKPVIYEVSSSIGGISRTVNYKGNRIDLGGHRFFSKSDRVMQWWQNILPLQGAPAKDDIVTGRNICGQQNLSETTNRPDPEKTDRVMLIRNRISRIYFRRRFFDYPISVNFNTLSNLGLIRIIRIALSYLKTRVCPIKEEKSLEDFLTNRFGRELYLTFFQDYTKKVWGVPPGKIKPEWGAQRIKGLSITKAIQHAVRNTFLKDSSVAQRNTETSLIKQFMYPKFGPGQLWEEVARVIKEKGGQIYLRHKVNGLKHKGKQVVEVEVRNEITGDTRTGKGDYFFSSMPVSDLIDALGEGVCM